MEATCTLTVFLLPNDAPAWRPAWTRADDGLLPLALAGLLAAAPNLASCSCRLFFTAGPLAVDLIVHVVAPCGTSLLCETVVETRDAVSVEESTWSGCKQERPTRSLRKGGKPVATPLSSPRSTPLELRLPRVNKLAPEYLPYNLAQDLRFVALHVGPYFVVVSPYCDNKNLLCDGIIVMQQTWRAIQKPSLEGVHTEEQKNGVLPVGLV